MLENKEIWKDCKGYEGRYQVSNLGNVWSCISQKKLKLMTNIHGYYTVMLYAKNGKAKRESVHRLVALAFLDNPNNYPCVNHKDEIRTNNCVDNLEWCSSKYNSNYGTCQERHSINRGTAIAQFDADHKLIATFNSYRQAEEKTHHCRKGIAAAIKSGTMYVGCYWHEYQPNT